MHPHRNALAAPLLLPCILMAAPALEWRADLADTGAATLYARHGDEIGLSCRLSLRGEPYAPASAQCHYQTNGMGAAWWEAPVSLASNVATVAWSPALDPGADLVLLMLEFDGAHRAALHLHLRPGPSGGSAPLPPPTAVLDFATQPYTNAPWALPSDIPPAPDLSPYATWQGLDSATALAATDYGPWQVESGMPEGYRLVSAFATETPVGVLWVVGIRPAGAGDDVPPDFSSAGGTIDDTRITVHYVSPAAELTLSRAALAYRLGPADGANANRLVAPAGDYATTGYVARAIADAVPAGGDEWATNTYAYITWSPEASPAQAYEEDWLDARRLVQRSAGVLSSRLHAWRERRDEEFIVEEISGTWELVSGGQYATLSNGVLYATGTTGTVAVRFSGEGQSLSALVPMDYTLPGSTVIAPCAEQHPSNAVWRTVASQYTAGIFAGVPTVPASSYRHGRGGEPDYYCEIPDSLQLYTTAENRNPLTVNPDFFDANLADLMRCQSVGRTDFYTGSDTRPALFISPHVAICAAHYTPREATFCLDRAAPSFRRFTFRQLTGAPGLPADLGDLRVLWSDEAFPTNLLPRFIRAEELRNLSPSLYAAGVGLYQSQHGTVHPCIVWPIRDNGGWAAIHPGFDGVLAPLYGRNDTWSAALTPYQHIVHGGDSGHAVFLRWYYADESRYVLVPIGLYHYATGSGESLLSADVQSWLHGIMNPLGESVSYIF